MSVTPDRVHVKWRGEESGETIVSFKEEKISSIMISLMNQVDDGYIQRDPFQKSDRLSQYSP